MKRSKELSYSNPNLTSINGGSKLTEVFTEDFSQDDNAPRVLRHRRSINKPRPRSGNMEDLFQNAALADTKLRRSSNSVTELRRSSNSVTELRRSSMNLTVSRITQFDKVKKNLFNS